MNRKRLLIVFILGIAFLQAFIVLSLIVFFDRQNQSAQLARVNDLNRSQLSQAAQSITQFIDSRASELKILAKNPLIAGNSPEECQENIRNISNSVVNFDSFSRMNNKGIFDCSANPTTVGIDGKTIGEYINTILNDPEHKTVVSQPLVGDETFVAMHVPIFDENRQFLGTIGSAIFLDEIDEEFIQPLTGAVTDTHVLIMDKNGFVVNYNKDSSVHALKIDQSMSEVMPRALYEFANSAVDTNGALLRKQADGFNLNLVRAKIIDTDQWYVISATPELNEPAVFFGTIDSDLVNNGTIAVLFVIVSAQLVTLYYLTRIIFDPLAHINTTIRSFRMGSRTARIEDNLDATDDIGKISRSFNTMAEELSETEVTLQKKINSATKVLEQQKKLLEIDKIRDDALIASLGEGIAVTDEYGKITRVNQTLLKLFKVKEKDVIGKPIVETLQLKQKDGRKLKPENHAAFKAVLTGKVITERYQVGDQGKNHDALFIDLIASPYLLNDKPSGTVVVYRDATFEEEIDRAKSEFVSLASHQLRTPLTTINWYLEILLSKESGKLNKQQSEYLNIIQTANVRLTSLVSSLLNVSRIDMGTFRITPKKTNLQTISKNVISELGKLIHKKKLTVSTSFTPDSKAYVADEQLMYIIFQNLLSNAAKYTPEKGKINLKITKDTSHMIISVSDTGCGIPEKDQKEIFKKMYRASNVLSMDTDGTGLGLYTIKAIVEEAGGSITFISKQNKGSTFTITLPLKGMKKREGTRVLDHLS